MQAACVCGVGQGVGEVQPIHQLCQRLGIIYSIRGQQPATLDARGRRHRQRGPYCHMGAARSPISIDAKSICRHTFLWTSLIQKGQNGQNSLVMDKNSPDPVQCWLAWVKAFQVASKYLYAGIEETGLCDTDYRILEVLLNKGPLPMNTIAARVNLTPGPISVGVDRLFERGLVSRVESPEDRRVRVISLTSKGKGLITPVFRKHSAKIRKVFADASQKEVRNLETILKKIGKRAARLGTRMEPRSRSCLSETSSAYNGKGKISNNVPFL